MNALKLLCIFSILLMTACTPPKSPPELPIENAPLPRATKIKSNSISSWEISGALAARNKKKGWTASLNWLQQGANQYQIRLFGPLGGGTIMIANNSGMITYTDGPKKLTSRDADELLQQQTGVRLPVHDLYYWVRGIPAPGTVQSSQYDQNAHLVSLTQEGYTIDYTDYILVNSIDLPSKIQLQGHDVIIKLVIKRWKI